MITRDVWTYLRTPVFRRFSDSSGIFHFFFPSIIPLLLNDTPSRAHIQEKPPHPCLHVEQLCYDACTSSTMDRVFTVPHMHPDVRGNGAPAHQFGLWPHRLQDVPQQAAPQSLSLWPDGHQHWHRAAARQLCPATAGWWSGEAFRLRLQSSITRAVMVAIYYHRCKGPTTGCFGLVPVSVITIL